GSVKDLDVEDGKWYKRRHDDAYNSAGCVNNWRVPRTTTTLSWRNGEVGRLFVTIIASDKVTEQQLQEAKALRGFAVVERAQGPTHMWRGQTMVRYLDFLAEELKEPTKTSASKFRVDLVAAGGQMINGTTLGDFCAAHGFGKRPVAGANNPAFARQCQELQFDLFGQVSLKTPLLVSLASDVYALKSLAAHREGNIVMSSWLKLGHISAQELANLRFAGRLEDLEACMSHVRGSMLQLDVLPDLGLEAAAQELDNGQISQALQNKHHVWWVHDAEERCIPLPAHQDWEKTKQERAPKALTVCQQAKYDQWLAHPQRDLLLDLSRCCRTNKGGKNVALISLRLSMLPEELQMRCDDTWKPLFVRQYMSAEEHPVVQDLPLGIQQPAPAHLLQPGLDSAPEPDGEDMEASEQG
ncbi:unnamed protein product, partial [Symbiodinium sp. KB8]